ncbi:MAG: hypothetical protein U1F56_07505 [Rubrivivax sp.]
MSTSVFYFGGYKASQTDMNLWLASARAQQPDVAFSAWPWPAGTRSDDVSAAAGARKAGIVKAALAAIGQSGADKVYIVGHSSGCAIANAVDDELKDHERVALVALDGFSPGRGQLARASTQVWAAECDGVVTANHPWLLKAVGSRLKVWQATDCKRAWALHFSVVNAASSDRTVTKVEQGYANCRTNLMWLC